jgi:hypothetical protein
MRTKDSDKINQTGQPTAGLRLKLGIFLFGWISIYTAKWIPGFESNPLVYAVGGDLLILVSLFVLGGDFWDKVRSLFIHNAEARF